jgi:hypothetical protein
MMEAASTSETSANFYHTTKHNNQEDSHFHTRRHENLKSQRGLGLYFIPEPSLWQSRLWHRF